MSVGGVETVIVNTLQGLNYSKFDVTLFIMYKTNEEKENLKKIPDKVKIKYLFKEPPAGYLQIALYYLFMFFPPAIMNKLIVKEPFDIIITTKDVFTYPISANTCKKIMWVHGGLEHLKSDRLTFSNKLKYAFKKIRYGRFDKIILLTNSAKENFCSKFPFESKCIILANPINTVKIEKLSKEPVKDYTFNENLTIVCSSRLSIEKGVERLIKSCEILLKEGYNFNLLILGDGPEKLKLEQLIEKDPLLREKITMLGFRKNPFKYMSKSSLYISPSFTEGYSLSIAEAIILGLPIIGTDCDGNAAVLDNGKYGLLVENSESGIYVGLRKMLSSSHLLLEYRLKSQERQEFFSYEKNIKLLEKIIS
ncbi:glycosyltransferase [Bacillus sp. AGMB 02131]|uniref:Glycosyltransferase n=2 Tax=Peribacillus faecalis TaxID=2772559 RepID=A0A927CYI2_9BACI|nr:glycosyltransferase [Peribacillus faecalis]